MKAKGKSILCIVLAFALFISLCYISLEAVTHRPPHVMLGVDNIDENMELFENKRVGLITNATGVDSNFESTIDVLNEKVNLTTLFAPEHGIRGAAAAGDNVENEVDEKTGLPVYSLYGDIKKPTPQMLENVDVLVYDIQDVGARFYTYISTMKYAMEAAAENGKTFVVLDRPNPISGDIVQGCVLDEAYEGYVGVTEIPQRYGLTSGELAMFINQEDGIYCDLHVIKMKNWDRSMYYDETGLQTWIMPSPNIPTVDTALVYSGTCLFEGTNVSEGRGTTKPFEIIGAPWINANELAEQMNALHLPGVFFRPTTFTPTTSKFKNESCNGVEIQVLDRASFDSVKTGVSLLYTIRDLYPNDFAYLENHYIDDLTGGDYIRTGKFGLDELYDKFDQSSLAFQEKSKQYYLYT